MPKDKNKPRGCWVGVDINLNATDMKRCENIVEKIQDENPELHPELKGALIVNSTKLLKPFEVKIQHDAKHLDRKEK